MSSQSEFRTVSGIVLPPLPASLSAASQSQSGPLTQNRIMTQAGTDEDDDEEAGSDEDAMDVDSPAPDSRQPARLGTKRKAPGSPEKVPGDSDRSGRRRPSSNVPVKSGVASTSITNRTRKANQPKEPARPRVKGKGKEREEERAEQGPVFGEGPKIMDALANGEDLKEKLGSQRFRNLMGVIGTVVMTLDGAGALDGVLAAPESRGIGSK